MTVPSVTVVVPTRDKAASLRLTLRCLKRQGDPASYEVIVVDDGSQDDTPRVIAAAAEDGLPVRVINGPGEGRATARNAGAGHAAGALLVFLDDDILVPDGWLKAHQAAHAPRAAAVSALSASRSADALACVHGPLRELPGAPRMVTDSTAMACADPFALAAGGAYGRSYANALERAIAAMALGQLPAVAPWLACVGANTSLPRALWQRTGGYDQRFGTTWGCEDLEFGYRLDAAGAALALAERAAGIHLSHARTDRWEQHSVNLGKFTAKHPDPAVLALPALLGPRGSPAGYLAEVRRLGTRQ